MMPFLPVLLLLELNGETPVGVDVDQRARHSNRAPNLSSDGAADGSVPSILAAAMATAIGYILRRIAGSVEDMGIEALTVVGASSGCKRLDQLSATSGKSRSSRYPSSLRNSADHVH